MGLFGSLNMFRISNNDLSKSPDIDKKSTSHFFDYCASKEEIEILKAKNEVLKKERREKRREEERLRKLNRTEWEKEYDEYQDLWERELSREEMLRILDKF